MTTPARTILDQAALPISDSDLERLFRPIALAAGLPQPLTKVFVDEFEVDFYRPDLSLVVETDSLRYHRTAMRQSRDLLRDQVHTASGLTTCASSTGRSATTRATSPKS